MRKFRTLDEIEADYFRKHPEEIDPYISEIFEEYVADGDSAALLASLRIIAQVKGLTAFDSEIGTAKQDGQKELVKKGNPLLDSVNVLMKALGYRLSPQKIEL